MLDAAVTTFARCGYGNASMDGIAERAGISKPLVYLYLHSKEELFAACIRREAEALVQAVRDAVLPGDGTPPRQPAQQMLWDGLTAFFSHTAEHPDGWAVLHNQARRYGEPFSADVAAMRAEIVAFVTRLIADAARETACATAKGGEARHTPSSSGGAEGGTVPFVEVEAEADELAEREIAGLAHALVGAAESLAAWANDRGGDRPSAKETAGTLMNFAWAGLENLTNGQRWSPHR
ncbi:TetR/AcrR family transcriptional regulator [Streptomyces sp. NPDC047108]|uniref:TetR/AcrR family transcriptional regulator n=1 Tax=Streptomyces sp. NPDC047108 TaxID=3155025 RepID=UPI0033FBD069